MVDRHEGGRGKERAIIGQSVGVAGEELIIHARTQGNDVCPIEEEEDNEYPHEFPGASFHVFLTFTNFCVCGHRMKVDEQVFALITALLVGVVTAFISNKTGADGLSPSASDRRIADDLLYATRVTEEFQKTTMIHFIAEALRKEATVIQANVKAASHGAIIDFDRRIDMLRSAAEKGKDMDVKDHTDESAKLGPYFPALKFDPAKDSVGGMEKFKEQTTSKTPIKMIPIRQLNCKQDYQAACIQKLLTTIAPTDDYDTLVFFVNQPITTDLYISVRSQIKNTFYIVATFPLSKGPGSPSDPACPFGSLYYVVKCPDEVRKHLNRGRAEYNDLLLTATDSRTNRYMLDDMDGDHMDLAAKIFAPSTIRKYCNPIFNSPKKVLGVFGQTGDGRDYPKYG